MKIGRNDPCPCGSGKKYKKCCMNKPQIDFSFDQDSYDLYSIGKTNKGEIAWIVSPSFDLEDPFQTLDLPQQFIEQYYHSEFHLVFIDEKQKKYIYINNPVCDIKNDITKIMHVISSSEHTWIDSIAADASQQLYFINITISRGRFNTDVSYSWNDDKLQVTDIPVPDISYIEIFSDNAIKELCIPVIAFDNDEINSLRDYSLSSLYALAGHGQIDDEIAKTKQCIEKIEKVYNIRLIGDRAHLEQVRYDLKNVSTFECAKFFNIWRKGIVDRYTGKVCTAELTYQYYGMDASLNNLPVLVLSDVQELSTFYESVFNQFPVRQDMSFSIPFDDFAIKVSDSEGKTLYVVVHKRDTYYELIGLSSTSNDESNANMDFVLLSPNGEMQYQFDMGFLSTEICKWDNYSAPCIKVPFDYLDNISITLSNGSHYKTSAYQWWNDIAIEFSAGTEDVVNDLKAPCSDILIIHVWLHALAMYHVMLNMQRVEYVRGCNGALNSIESREYKNISNKCIIDLGRTKRIYVYTVATNL